MASFQTCDGGCGTASPDPKTGLYTQFLTVKAKREHGGYVSEEAIYCPECAHRVLGAMAPLDAPLQPFKPPRRPLISGLGLFWLCVLAVCIWLIVQAIAAMQHG